jgi:hypothetical protein
MNKNDNEPLHFSAESILFQLDKAWTDHAFPSLITNAHWGFGKARLSTYRSPGEWLILIELLVYYNGFGDFDVILYGYGNRLEKIGVDPYFSALAPRQSFPSSEFGLHVPPPPT